MSQPELIDRQGHSYRKFQARAPWPGDEDRSELWLRPTHSWKLLSLAAGCFVIFGILLAVIFGR